MTVEGEGVIGASCGAVVVGDGDGAKGNMTIDDYARAWYVRCLVAGARRLSLQLIVLSRLSLKNSSDRLRCASGDADCFV